MRMADLKNIIPLGQDVGLAAVGEDVLPIVDTWEHWINGGLNTLDVEVKYISSCGYLLLELKV